MLLAEKLIGQLLFEKLTKGMRNAYSRMEGHVKVCVDCRLVVPKYPGRYPQSCPECGDQLEDMQNAPVYSEQSDKHKAYGSQMRVVSKKTRIGRE